MSSNVLARGAADASREVRRLAVPAILHSLLQTLVFVVDRVMLGHYSDASLAAMQLAGNLEWSIWSVFAAFEVGTIARVGRHVGAGHPARARQAAWLSVGVAAALGGAIALASPSFLRALPALVPDMGAASMAEARRYLSVTMAASPVVFLSMTAVAVLQAGGDTRTPLFIGIFANVVHVALNRVLILGVPGFAPAMGARGAAISTAITFALGASLALAALSRRDRPVSLRGPRLPEPVRPELVHLARVAGPAFVERAVYHVGYVGYVVLLARLGDAAMAANQSLISVESICFLSGEGFGIAAAALVAQKLGARDPPGARRAALIATRYAVVALTACGVSALALRGVILPLFSRDPAVVSLGAAAMPFLAVAQPFMACGMVLGQALRGAGRTREALLASVVGAVVVRLSATWLFGIALGLGLPGAWLGSTADWVVRSVILAALALRRGGFDQR